MKIEWASDFHSDGTRKRKRPVSVFHGWMVKWRATFMGNERLRNKGIREMREAKALNRHRKKQQARERRQSESNSMLSILGFGRQQQKSPSRRQSRRANSAPPGSPPYLSRRATAPPPKPSRRSTAPSPSPHLSRRATAPTPHISGRAIALRKSSRPSHSASPHPGSGRHRSR